MRKVLLAALTALLALVPLSVFASGDIAVVVTKITGKAQIQKGSDWEPLVVGQKINTGDTVSTGFRSELLVSIGPSIVTIKPLSRLTLKTLVQSGTELQTELYLKVGKVNAEVNKSEAVTSQSFKVSSPIATASVRGTEFSFDTITLEVTRGLVQFSDQKGNVVQVPLGELAQAALPGSNQGIATNQLLVLLTSTVSAQPGSEFGTAGASSASTSDLLSALISSYLNQFYFDNSGSGASHFYIGGIIPAPTPAETHISVGGITPAPTPNSTFVSIGGITPVPAPTITHISIGGISPAPLPNSHILVGGIVP